MTQNINENNNNQNDNLPANTPEQNNQPNNGNQPNETPQNGSGNQPAQTNPFDQWNNPQGGQPGAGNQQFFNGQQNANGQQRAAGRPGGQQNANGQPGQNFQPAQPAISQKEQKKIAKLEKAKARTTEEWMKREKKIVIIFSIVCAVLLILTIVGFASGHSSGDYTYTDDDTSYYDDSSDSSDTEYTAVTADELIDELEDNAAAAKDKYVDTAVAITGKISNIDNDSQYISLEPLNDDFTLDSIDCYTNSTEQEDAVKKLKNGQKVTVYGTISDVGEVLGYSVTIDSIETD